MKMNRLHTDSQLSIGVALAEVIRSDSPSFTSLDVSLCGLDEAALVPLFGALRVNTHLAALACRVNAWATSRALGAAILAGVTANASLRDLDVGVEEESSDGDGDGAQDLVHATALVRARAAG